MKNRVKERLKQGLPAVGNWINIPSPAVAELLASYGMDWLLIDTEHAPTDYETIENLLRAMQGTDVVPLMRVAGNDAVLIKKALDRGAMGVLVPLVNSAEEAAAAVSAAKYPPEGIRGVAGTRANRYGADLREYFDTWNEEVLVGVQVETRQAVEQVEAIAAVPGIDLVFVGPNDLSANLGVYQQYDHPIFQEAIHRVLKATRDHGVAAGYMASDSASVLGKIEEGFTFVSAGSDTRLLGAATAATYGAIERGLEKLGLR